MKKFLLKCLFLTIPFVVLIIFFVTLDPFRIVKNYSDYSKDLFVIPNRDFISTEVYKRNRIRYKYDSFIFGSSRTIAYKTDSWRTHLDSTASPFVFDASGESVFGIYKKIKYIDKNGDRLNNCLIILCTDCSFLHEADHEGHLGIKHPAVAGTSWLHFYWVFFKAYLDRGFFKSYHKYLLTHTYDSSMKNRIETNQIKWDTITNDEWVLNWEKELTEHPDNYYDKRKNVFYDREKYPSKSKSQITDKQKLMLEEIKQIFDRQHTKYKIVISPLYSQVKFNEKDFRLLNEIFGDQVYDFSGKNDFTKTKYNYYESSHYRPFIGDKIMSLIYR